MRRNLCSSTVLLRLAIATFLGGGVAMSGFQHIAAAQQVLTVEAFRVDPNLVLQRNPAGGAAMVSALRDISIADRTTLPTILGLIAAGNVGQKSAIGAALAQAAEILGATEPGYAGQIQRAVVLTADQDVVVAYGAVRGDTRDRDRSDHDSRDRDDHHRDDDHRHCHSCPVSPSRY